MENLRKALKNGCCFGLTFDENDILCIVVKKGNATFFRQTGEVYGFLSEFEQLEMAAKAANRLLLEMAVKTANRLLSDKY